jgi:hypothetical protein
MSEEKRHTGSCHCKRVRYAVTAKIDGAMQCNCSICARAGYLLAFVDSAKFELLEGEGAQTDYQFAKHHIHHLFCSTCGVRCFGYGANPDGAGVTYAVNVRTFDDPEFDLSALEIQRYDGRAL